MTDGARESPSAPATESTAALPRGLGGFLALLIYAALTILFFGRTLLSRFSTAVLGRGIDPTIYLWSFKWWRYALSRGRDPFFTHVIWAPSGLNLAWTTCMPAAARLAGFLTARTGPVVPYNVFCLACPALAGWAAFLLCHHFTRRFWPSLLGGYVFGFSAYMLGQTLGGHLPYQCVFAVPLVLLLAVLLIEEARPRWLIAAALALLLALEFGLALEVFATLTFFGAIAYALCYFFAAAGVRARMRTALGPIVATYAVALAIQWDYLYHLCFFAMPAGRVNSPTTYSAGLLNFLCPTPAVELGRLGLFAALAARFPGNLFEAGAYLGPFLILAVVLWIRAHWKEHAARALFWVLIAIALAALGPRLHVAGWIGPGMPWKVFTHLPLIGYALPARFTVYAFLGAGLIAALYFAERPITAPRALLAALIVLAMVPNLSSAFWGGPLDMPPFFTTGLYRSYLSPDQTAVVLPYGPKAGSMLWQAESGFYFKMAGGYMSPLIPPEFAGWPIVDALLHETAIPSPRAQLLAFMAAHHAGVVLLDARARHRLAPFVATLGIAPTAAGGVLIYRVNAAALAPYRGASVVKMEQRCDRERFDTLLRAAAEYLAKGRDPARLTPLAAQRLGLLPPDWVRDAGVRTGNGLFLGPRPGGRIAVGINASYAGFAALLTRYGRLASAIYFPYPHRLDAASHRKPGIRMMVMVFDRAALTRAGLPALGDEPGAGDVAQSAGLAGDAISPDAPRPAASR